jgi:hypothetical protein
LIEFFKWVDTRNESLAELRPVLRFLLTWLDLGKVYTIPKQPSLAPITTKSSALDPTLEAYDIKEALISLGIVTEDSQAVFKTACENFTFHESAAAGPNGHAL